MNINFKIFVMAIGLSCGISSTNYGSEMEEMTIHGGTFRLAVMEAIKDANSDFNFDSSAITLELLGSKLAALESFNSGENSLENEWLALRIQVLETMIKIYTDNNNSIEVKEEAIDKLRYDAFVKQWSLIQKSVFSKQLMNHLRNLYLIYVEQRDCDQEPRKLSPETLEQFSQAEAIKSELKLRESSVVHEFLEWFYNTSQDDNLAKTELDFLDKIGVLPREEIKLLAREIYSSERPPESLHTE